jgi:hypothetical protein
MLQIIPRGRTVNTFTKSQTPQTGGGPPVTQHGFQTTSLPACTTSRETGVRGLAKDIARAEPKLAQKTVAILLPETRGLSNEAEALELTDALTNEIVSNSHLKVVERGHLREILHERELEQSGATDAQTAAKVGRLLLSFRSVHTRSLVCLRGTKPTTRHCLARIEYAIC